MDRDLDAWIDKCRGRYRKLSARAKSRWARVLPIWELTFDRWEHAKQVGFGDGASVYHSCHLYGDVIVGGHTWIGPYTILDGSGGGIRIGEYCSISAGAQVYTHHTVKWALTGGKAAYERCHTCIEDCCYIGPYAVISMGVVVGHHSVIGAHALVNRSVEPYSIMYGVPARRVGRVVVGDAEVVTLEYFKEPTASAH
jgi:acetyltransferase-like isoleucine patch superfamily enzyme